MKIKVPQWRNRQLFIHNELAIKPQNIYPPLQVFLRHVFKIH